MLTIARVYANYLAMTTVKLKSLNSNRLAVTVLGWISDDKKLPSPSELSRQELNSNHQGKLREKLCDKLRNSVLHGQKETVRLDLLRKTVEKMRQSSILPAFTIKEPEVYESDCINDIEPMLPGWIWGYKAMLYMNTNKYIDLKVGVSIQEAIYNCCKTSVKSVNGYSYDDGRNEYVINICEHSPNSLWIGLLLWENIGRSHLLLPSVHVRACVAEAVLLK